MVEIKKRNQLYRFRNAPIYIAKVNSYFTFISNSIPLRLWVIIDSAIAIGYLSSGLDCKEQLVKKERDSLLAKPDCKKKSGKDWLLDFIFMENII